MDDVAHMAFGFMLLLRNPTPGPALAELEEIKCKFKHVKWSFTHLR